MNIFISRLKKQTMNDNQNNKTDNNSCTNNTIILFGDKSECNGCGACQALCPRFAIEMKEMDEFYYPEINAEKCIKCYNCIHICPINRY